MKHDERTDAIDTFKKDPAVTVLVMDEVGALGLDLSFVSWLFLMDPVWDASTEDQIVSRAHRIGASQVITVEKLMIKGSIEEQLARVHATSDAGRDADGLDDDVYVASGTLGSVPSTPCDAGTPRSDSLLASSPHTPVFGNANESSLSVEAARVERAKISTLLRTLRRLPLLEHEAIPMDRPEGHHNIAGLAADATAEPEATNASASGIPLQLDGVGESSVDCDLFTLWNTAANTVLGSASVLQRAGEPTGNGVGALHDIGVASESVMEAARDGDMFDGCHGEFCDTTSDAATTSNGGGRDDGSDVGGATHTGNTASSRRDTSLVRSVRFADDV